MEADGARHLALSLFLPLCALHRPLFLVGAAIIIIVVVIRLVLIVIGIQLRHKQPAMLRMRMSCRMKTRLQPNLGFSQRRFKHAVITKGRRRARTQFQFHVIRKIFILISLQSNERCGRATTKDSIAHTLIHALPFTNTSHKYHIQG